MPINPPLLAGSLTTAILANAIDPVGALTLSDAHWRFKTPLAISAYAPRAKLARDLPLGFAAQNDSAAEWMSLLASNARRLSELKAGWDGPGSVPISQKTLFRATVYVRSSLENLTGVSAPRLVPGGDGSVQIEWHAKHGELEFDIDSRGDTSIWIRDHRNGAEFDGENEAAVALFYRWAPWVASRQRDDFDAPLQAQIPFLSIAA
jgi:hypothetical protein